MLYLLIKTSSDNSYQEKWSTKETKEHRKQSAKAPLARPIVARRRLRGDGALWRTARRYDTGYVHLPNLRIPQQIITKFFSTRDWIFVRRQRFARRRQRALVNANLSGRDASRVRYANKTSAVIRAVIKSESAIEASLRRMWSTVNVRDDHIICAMTRGCLRGHRECRWHLTAGCEQCAARTDGTLHPLRGL